MSFKSLQDKEVKEALLQTYFITTICAPLNNCYPISSSVYHDHLSLVVNLSNIRGSECMIDYGVCHSMYRLFSSFASMYDELNLKMYYKILIVNYKQVILEMTNIGQHFNPSSLVMVVEMDQVIKRGMSNKYHYKEEIDYTYCIIPDCNHRSTPIIRHYHICRLCYMCFCHNSCTDDDNDSDTHSVRTSNMKINSAPVSVSSVNLVSKLWNRYKAKVTNVMLPIGLLLLSYVISHKSSINDDDSYK